MASDLGNTPVRQYMNNGSNGAGTQTRQIFHTRYIYWFVAWPLALIANRLLGGLGWATICFAVALLEFWIVTLLCGAVVATSYRWGYFALGCFAYLVLAHILLSLGRSRSGGMRSTKSYTMLSGLLVVVWAVYLVAWGLSEGSNRLSIATKPA